MNEGIIYILIYLTVLTLILTLLFEKFFWKVKIRQEKISVASRYVSQILLILIGILFAFSTVNYTYFIENDTFRDIVFSYQVLILGHYSGMYIFYPVSFTTFLNTIIIYVTNFNLIIMSKIIGFLFFLEFMLIGKIILKSLLGNESIFLGIYLASPLVFYSFLGMIPQFLALIYLTLLFAVFCRYRVKTEKQSELILIIILSVSSVLAHPATALYFILFLVIMYVTMNRSRLFNSHLKDSIASTIAILTICTNIYVFYTQIVYGMLSLGYFNISKIINALGQPLPEIVSAREIPPYDLFLKYIGISTLFSLSTALFIRCTQKRDVANNNFMLLLIENMYIISSSLLILGYLISTVGGPSSIYRYTLIPSIYFLALLSSIYLELLSVDARKVVTVIMLFAIILSLINGVLPIEELNITKTPYSPTTGNPFKNTIVTSLSSFLNIKLFNEGYYIIYTKLSLLRAIILKNIINNQEDITVNQLTEITYTLSYNDANVLFRGTEENFAPKIMQKVANLFYVLNMGFRDWLQASNVFWNDGKNLITEWPD